MIFISKYQIFNVYLTKLIHFLNIIGKIIFVKITFNQICMKNQFELTNLELDFVKVVNGT
jgi:hypothetical protein